MPNRSRRRSGAVRIEGRRRATDLASRLGVGLREARRGAALRQADVSSAAGVSQSWVSRMERGAGHTASIETWAAVAAASGAQLVCFLEEQPGATRPHDYQHLRRQQLIASVAARGGWRATAERAVDPSWRRSRSIDVLLERKSRHEIAVVEVVDWFDDVGAAWRGLDAKVATVARDRASVELAGGPRTRVAGLLLIRGTRRNRLLVREFSVLFRTHFPARSRAWLEALQEPNRPMPAQTGFLWTDVGGSRLIAARL